MSSTPELAPRYPCPVCLGVQMVKLKPEVGRELVLDYCERCGGIWFDAGEADQIRACHPQALTTKVKLSDRAFVMQCHSCHAAMARNAERCSACGEHNVLLCPACEEVLKPVTREGLTLDVCRRCRGAWFDNVELAAIWNRKVDALERRDGGAYAGGEVVADYFFIDAFLWGPGLFTRGPVIDVPRAVVGDAGSVLAEGGGAAGSVAEVAGDLVDKTGDLAGSVFGWVADFFGNVDFDFIDFDF